MAEPKSPPRLTDRKRAAVLAAAVSEFRAKGFDSTSMDRIAEVAGVSKRTVYNHFSSKEVLFEAMVHQLKQRCAATAEFAYAPDVPLDEQLAEIARSVIAINASEDFQDLARVILARFLHAPELAQRLIGEAEEFSTGVANWIRAACQAGQLEVSSADRAAKQFKGLLNAFTFWPQVMGREPAVLERERDEIVHSTVRMFLDHYSC